jgi:BirA family biotin operon repressor/biotin-[acetyl-CoA-carboxylase] ligase
MKFDIRRLETTASTNDDARQAAALGAAAGTVIWALQQSAGRGRQGRTWSSPAGNLYCSVLLRPAGGITTYSQYSFLAALALSDVVRELLHEATVELKWPNDVLVGGKKISGILLESGEGFLIVGMGLNVRHFPANALYPVTSLAAEGAELPPLEELLDRLLQALDERIDILNKSGFAAIRAAWLERARTGLMQVRQADSEIQGHFAGLDEDGNLRLRLPDGAERLINTGDVFF